MSEQPGPVTSGDVTAAVRLTVELLSGKESADWTVKAGSLDWDCWETVEHLADDLFAYAGQLGPENPPLDTHVPFGWRRLRPDGPALAVYVDRAEPVAGLLQVLEASGGLLAAMVSAAPSTRRAHHVHGAADPEGFAAMGVVETLVHTHDVAAGLGLEWRAPGELSARVLARLFPDAPTDTEPWPTLLWATGRGELPGRERLTEWRWYGEPREDSGPA